MLDRTSIGTVLSLRAGDLYDAFARSRHAICKEQTRYYLAGVYIHPSADRKTLNFVATDGHRLAHVRVPIAEAVEFAPVLVGTHFVIAALKVLGRKSQHLLSVTLTLAPRSVTLVNWQGQHIETTPIDGSYPDYSRVIPSDAPVRAIVVKDELVAALEPIAGFLKPTSQRALKLSAQGDTLALSASVKTSYPHEVPASAQTVVKLAKPVDQPYETGFNADYLLEALRTFSRSPPVVSICSHDFRSPHVLECDSHETYVLMPMRI